MSRTIKQRVMYELNGKFYGCLKEAETAALDEFGEHFDGIVKGVDFGSMSYIQVSKLTLAIVERIWADRQTVAALLSLDYESSYEVFDE